MGRKNHSSGVRTLSLGERQATLRRTCNFVQDIVSTIFRAKMMFLNFSFQFEKKIV